MGVTIEVFMQGTKLQDKLQVQNIDLLDYKKQSCNHHSFILPFCCQQHAMLIKTAVHPIKLFPTKLLLTISK